MNNLNTSLLVPDNTIGKAVDINHTIKLNKEEAKSTYNLARARLMNPDCWRNLAGVGTAEFELISANEDFKQVQENDYLRINIPGPGSIVGDGYDWVKVEKIEENNFSETDRSIGLKLRASSNPNNDKTDTAHFFKKEATSTFIIKQEDNVVTASYYGRNEVPNVENVSMLDKVRNTVVATGAAIGLSELQWNALIKGFLQ